MNILFIGKNHDEYVRIAAQYLRQLFPNSEFVLGVRGDKFPKEYEEWRGDYIFSYLSPWIIPQALLERTEKGAINWHPGPPEYPGIGCTNFAVYNGEREFGITCHYMAAKVDTGKIIEVRRLPVIESDTVYSITQTCYALILASFFSVLDRIFNGVPLPESNETWKRKPFTRKELDVLCEITPEMDLNEIDRRIKATTYDKPWAFTEIKGRKFYWRKE